MSASKGTITRRLESAFVGLGSQFGTVCTRFDMESKLHDVSVSIGKSDYYTKLGNLFELLDSLDIEFNEDGNYEYFAKLIKGLDLPDFEDLQYDMVNSLYKVYKQYPSPEEYMLRMVNRLSNPEDNWQEDTLRLRILKQFIKYGNYLSDAEAGGRGYIKKYVKAKLGKVSSKDELETVLNAVDDEIFDVLTDASKDQKEFSGTYGLLKICDDLATGKFRMGGATKKSLYLFAIVYDMTFYVGKESGSQIIDYDRDIEKNLFQDYYANNLMRFISEAYKTNRSSFEKEPSGQGINYKNFAEMIYLYYISRSKEEYTPVNKIKLATDMINRVKETGFKAILESSKDTNTKHLKDIFCDDILLMNEEAFEEFIVTNYDIDTYVEYEKNGKISGNRVSEMQVSVEQNTAFEVFEEIVSELKEEVEIEDLTSGLWFADDEDFLSEVYEQIKEENPDVKKEDFDEFMYVISEMDKSSRMDVRLEEIKSSKDVTRTAIIVACYHLYTIQNEGDENIRFQSFNEVFKNFSLMVNEKLQKASYGSLSGKNIFDMLITFSIYAYQVI